jgi:hypothetical protein
MTEQSKIQNRKSKIVMRLRPTWWHGRIRRSSEKRAECRVTSDKWRRAVKNVKRKITGLALCALIFALGVPAEAGQAKVYRVGIIHQGGPYRAVVDGLRDGLQQLGYEEGKQILLDIRDTKSDLKLAEEAARIFEREKVNSIYTVTTLVTTAVKNVTSQIPIIFAVGSDPIASGLVQSFGKTRRETYRGSVLDHGSHGEAARDPKRKSSET